MKQNNGKLRNETRQAFLLTFFEDKTNKYEELEVNGFFLVKHPVGGTKEPQIAIYSSQSYEAMNAYKDNRLTNQASLLH